MTLRTTCPMPAALIATVALLVASSWGLALANAGFVWRGGAAAVIVLLERLVCASAPSPFGWVQWRTSLRHFVRTAAVAAAIGLAVLVAAVAFVRGLGLALDIEPRNFRSAGDFPQWIWFGVLQAPLVEEWVYRGLLQPRLLMLLGPRNAIVVSALLFWGGHWFAFGGPTAPHQFVAGLLFAWSWERTRSLVAPTLLHALNNLVLGLVDLLLLTQPEFVVWILRQ